MTGNIRSYLIQPAVVASSRDFVCVRLLTYESKSEYTFMEQLLGVAPGTLPNTVFCILAPDGKTKLLRAGRGPRQAFSGARSMATGLQRIAARYPAIDSESRGGQPQQLAIEAGMHAKALGNGEDDLPMRDGKTDLFADVQGSQKSPFLMAGGTRTALLAGEGDKHLMLAVGTANAGEAFLQIAALEIG